MTPLDGGLLSPREVAAWLKVSRRTVRRLVLAGELKAVRVGHRDRIQAASLQKYLGAGAEGARQ